MSWFPYKGHNSSAKISERDKNLYTIRAVAFTETRSIRRHTPTLGWQHYCCLSSGPRQTGRVRSAPLHSKFAKHHKGRMGGISHQGNHIAFGNYGLQALDHSWITSRHLEAGRKVLIQNARRSGKIWVRIFLYKPVTLRPT